MPSKKDKQTDSDNVLGRDLITAKTGWPPNANTLEHLMVFSDFIKKNLGKGSVLDVGCGDGAIDRLIASQNKLRSITATDLQAHPDWKTATPANLTFKTASIYKLPFKDNSFDIVFLKDVLHHLSEPEKALAEVSRVARKKVLVIEANRYNPISYIRMVKIAKHEHYSYRKLRNMVGKDAKIYHLENHVWPPAIKPAGKVIDVFFRLPVMKRARNYNLAIFKP